MKYLALLLLLLVGIYTIYLIKSELGINLSRRYHAIDIVKKPIAVIKRLLH
ncbi:MAG: hypothetical protein HC866_03950 [Leptolyngbyaceae cyanobacterium RU_5_1]|nr:hypothetical protein [Leptolyngbyaceae cyanobacterium RU_5_1]